MSKYRVLNSVAHNWAHSFLSLTHVSDDGFFIQALLDAVRAAHVCVAHIYPLTGEIEPSSLRSPAVVTALHLAPQWFLNILTSQNCAPSMICSVRLTVTFDLSKPFPLLTDVSLGHWFAPHIRQPECAPYLAEICIVDDRDCEHRASVREWWRS
jgi:hypothetical protein